MTLSQDDSKYYQCPALLPLLRAPSHAQNATAPALHLLPGGSLGPSRVIFQQEATKMRSTSSGSKVGSTRRMDSSTKRTGTTTTTMWISTNHTFPAAYPRSSSFSTTPPCPTSSSSLSNHPKPLPLDPNLAKEEEKRRRIDDLAEWDRRKRVYGGENLDPPKNETEANAIAEEMVSKAYPQLWSTVQRIVPVRDEVDSEMEKEWEDYTLLFFHANGFHKETWEKTIQIVLETLSSSSSAAVAAEGKQVRIEEIWSLDTMASGESGPLNRDCLGDLVSWFDGPRDIIQFVERYLPDQLTRSDKASGCARPFSFGPEWLPPILKPSGRTAEPLTGMGMSGVKKRKLIAIGHSYSGAALSLVSGVRPTMFDGIILIDPVLVHEHYSKTWIQSGNHPLDWPLAKGAIVRKDVFSSSQQALEYLKQRPFFAAWDPQVLISYARFGITPLHPSTSSAGWTLSMSKWHEAAYFAVALMQSSLALSGLRSGRFKGQIHHFTMGQDGVQNEMDTKAINEAIDRLGGTHETLDAGHLIVQEQPKLIGPKLAERIKKMFDGSRDAYRPPPARL